MKTEKDLISVIVPIYNVEAYLPKCIRSIMNQTYSNLQIILVDDGSTDTSTTISDKFKNEDRRIHVIHKENGGITSARKAGIQIAKGEYIGFVDGDDWVEENMYEKLHEYAKRDNAQVVLSGMYRDNDRGTYVKWSAAKLSAGIYLRKDKTMGISTKLFADGSQNVNGSLNNKLFEAELLKRNLDKVDDRIHGFADDTVCLFPCLLDANIVTIIDDAYYHGVDRYNSATHSKNEWWYEQLNLVYFRLKNVFENHCQKEILLKQLQTYIINSIFDGIDQLFPEIKGQKYFWIDDISEIKKKIVLYGAGKVGQSYFHQFQSSESIDVILWVDKNSEQYRKTGLDVCDISQIYKQEYDEIIIALKDEKIVGSVTEELVQNGIKKDKIIWKKPVSIFEYFYR